MLSSPVSVFVKWFCFGQKSAARAGVSHPPRVTSSPSAAVGNYRSALVLSQSSGSRLEVKARCRTGGRRSKSRLDVGGQGSLFVFSPEIGAQGRGLLLVVGRRDCREIEAAAELLEMLKWGIYRACSWEKRVLGDSTDRLHTAQRSLSTKMGLASKGEGNLIASGKGNRNGPRLKTPIYGPPV
ncbi:hypothetical protein STAS_26204 [Striga asiatica]|uniref:Uncharacterized protein n=1 Tax=Striga asiatica TaxID=4170 RepID=A0A5A7QUV2_STRAF|nr:hypothetical protein STAS_26204 [Striga asiatica]